MGVLVLGVRSVACVVVVGVVVQYPPSCDQVLVMYLVALGSYWGYVIFLLLRPMSQRSCILPWP